MTTLTQYPSTEEVRDEELLDRSRARPDRARPPQTATAKRVTLPHLAIVALAFLAGMSMGWLRPQPAPIVDRSGEIALRAMLSARDAELAVWQRKYGALQADLLWAETSQKSILAVSDAQAAENVRLTRKIEGLRIEPTAVRLKLESTQ
ncbi:MAG: hypothetical protein NTU93_01985 [Arthrobacter sp.]|nr:hypothetical protein [Arthrobacter sp.]